MSVWFNKTENVLCDLINLKCHFLTLLFIISLVYVHFVKKMYHAHIKAHTSGVEVHSLTKVGKKKILIFDHFVVKFYEVG